jgi:serine/threonine-protein kinase
LPGAFPANIRHYNLKRLLGQGGMGLVVEGEDRRDGSRVAVKLLYPHLAASDPTYLERFEREAHVAALLRSPYTVHLIDFGTEGNQYYLVMEFVEGESLAQRLAAGPLRPDDALRIGGEVARALEEAGARGIVHRDIKPENILLDSRGRVKVTDFGIARSSVAPGITMTGGFVGTPSFAAPEQVEGKVDHRTDVYSLGVTLYTMFAGRPPFQGRTPMDTLTQHRLSPVPMGPLAYLPDAIQNVVRRCMEKDPLDRYQSATELAGALDRARQVLSRGSTGGQPAPAAPLRPPADDPLATRVEPPRSRIQPPGATSVPRQGTPPPAMPRPPQAPARSGPVGPSPAPPPARAQQPSIVRSGPVAPPPITPTRTPSYRTGPVPAPLPPQPPKKKRPFWKSPVLLLPLLAVIVGGGAFGGVVAFAGFGEDDDDPPASASPSPTGTPTERASPTQGGGAGATPTLTEAPPTATPTPEGGFARILGIRLEEGRYQVAFETQGFDYALPGVHVHFFFDTIPPEQAGVPAPDGNWRVYGGGSPFTEYTAADRPAGAEKMCILVSNPDHAVRLGTGNCFDLPE